MLKSLPGILVATFMALAGPGICAYGGYWWAEDRPAWHVGFLWWHWGWGPGSAIIDAERAAQDHAAALRAAAVGKAQTAVTSQAATAEAAAQTKILTVYRTLHEQVPILVSPKVDNWFGVNVGFVRMYNAAVAGVPVSEISGPPGISDEAAAPVKLSTVADTTVSNFGACNSNTEELKGLQDWIRGEENADAVGIAPLK